MDLTTVVPDTMLNATTHAPEMIQSFINVTVKNCPGSQGGQMFLTILKVGMMASMVAASYAPWVRETRAYCIIRVVLRVFGIGSVCIAPGSRKASACVCIAVTMALERYLALTRPFLYQKIRRF
ncbi:hypothetical protein MSG28_012029 [Choristoneura fumiferana]|uniref:Uncharacterized protein n=1 Tax=Choristoneura fumiferana TaxID=7141 RepID=A0ACC0KND4_CHOFU|nr:hypothetical protein MSG28_012029 [Choristoneura fumiferana]